MTGKKRGLEPGFFFVGQSGGGLKQDDHEDNLDIKKKPDKNYSDEELTQLIFHLIKKNIPKECDGEKIEFSVRLSHLRLADRRPAQGVAKPIRNVLNLLEVIHELEIILGIEISVDEIDSLKIVEDLFNLIKEKHLANPVD